MEGGTGSLRRDAQNEARITFAKSCAFFLRRSLFFRPDHWHGYVQYFAASFNSIDQSASSSEAATSTQSAKDVASDCVKSESSPSETNGSSNENENNSHSAETSESSTQSASVVLNDVLTFLNQQIQCVLTDKKYEGRPLRGPFLAKLELLKRLKHRKRNETKLLSDIESPEKLLQQYYDQFGDKPCCFTDIRPYMELLPAAEQLPVSCV